MLFLSALLIKVFILSSRFVASLRPERATIQEPIFEAKGAPWTAVG